jgi:uncharacterized protein (TIGR03435 family)
MVSQSVMMFRGSAVPFANLVGSIRQQAGRPIIDKTELKGLYDFTLRFSPEGLPNFPGVIASPPPQPPQGGAPPAPAAPAAEPLPSIFTALQDLGLRLESTKGPVEVLVIDSVQKPTEN